MKSRALIFAGLTFLALPALAGADELTRLRKNGSEVYYTDLDLRAGYLKAKLGTVPESRRKLPAVTAKSFDWTPLVPRPYSYTQKQTPYCWAFAGVAAFELNWAIRNGGTPPVLAVQPIIDHTKKTGGAPGFLAMRSLLEHGTCPLNLYPYTGKPGPIPTKIDMAYRAIAWGSVSARGGVPTPEEIKKALLEEGPLAAGVRVTPLFHKYGKRSGVYNEHYKVKPGEEAYDHFVVIVGWDDRRGKGGAWKVENSWGPQWGEGGFMWIEYGCNNVGSDACWVRAQSNQYHLPADVHQSIGPDARPFHRWPRAKAAKAVLPELKPVTPTEAIQKRGQRVWVEFEPTRILRIQPAGDLALLSAQDVKASDCLAVVLLKSELSKFPVKDEKEVGQHYVGNKVQALGVVRSQSLSGGVTLSLIEIGNPDHIKVVE